MFNLFGKKQQPEQEQPKAPSQGKHPEVAALAAQFETQELDILAVTGPNGFGGSKLPDCELWTASLPLLAWREDDDGPICQTPAQLVAVADDKLLDYLRRRAPRDSIIQARVRRALEGDRFLLVGLPTPMMDPELKQILDESMKEITLDVEGLGLFTLSRSVDWFQLDTDWLGQSVQLTFDRGTPEQMSAAQDTARVLLADAQSWDARIRDYAAEQLLELKNDNWAEEGEAVDQDEFKSSMTLEAIQLYDRRTFVFWFNDGELFWGHSIRVEGDLDHGPTDAGIEG